MEGLIPTVVISDYLELEGMIQMVARNRSLELVSMIWIGQELITWILRAFQVFNYLGLCGMIWESGKNLLAGGGA